MSDGQRFWCELAWIDGAPAGPVRIEVAGDRIGGVSNASQPERGDDVLRGLTIAGLANAHSHAFQRALRGHTQTGTGSFWTWREQMYALAATLDPDALFAIARAVYAEMALAGVTVVGEFHYVHHAPDGTPYADPNEAGRAMIAAAGEAGIRITLLDACYLHGGIDRFRDTSVDTWVRRVAALDDGDLVRVGAAIHSIRAVTPNEAAVVADWAGDRPLHAHVSEQPAENADCVERFGATPTELLPISPTFTAVHATHLTEKDVARLAPATICMCPTTERDLADGVGPARRLAAAGARLAVGTDSHAVIDLFEEARAIELDERLVTGVRGHHTAGALLDAATRGGYDCLGWPDGGRLAPGALPDFITVATDTVRTAGTPPQALVFCATAADVRDVVVGGRRIVRDGRHVSIDVEQALAEALQR